MAPVTFEPRAARVLKALLLAGIVLAAFFAGVLAERLRFDVERRDMLRRYDKALRQHQEQIMQSEKQAAPGATR